MNRKTRRYEGEGIVVEFEPARCIHAERCVRGLPAVFDAEARPWIQPGKAPADAVAEVVLQCPTGALHYRRIDDEADEQPAPENTARLVADGPLYLAGRLRLRMPDGEVLEETRVALCRCGESSNKPFCDNAHLDRAFADPGREIEARLGAAGRDSGTLEVRTAPNGPILVEGPLRVIGADGTTAEGGKGALCRCGASGSKPYCDGTHTVVGFEAE